MLRGIDPNLRIHDLILFCDVVTTTYADLGLQIKHGTFQKKGAL